MKILVLRDNDDGTLHAYLPHLEIPNIEEFVVNFGDAAVFDTDVLQEVQFTDPTLKYGLKLKSLGQVIDGKLIA